MTEPSTPREWADLIGRNWQERSQSPSRDLFVASHPGWQDPETWERYARQELDLFLTNIDPDELKGFDVLEIGCGSGRLVPQLRPRVRSYTGLDIAAGMVDAARERCTGMDGVRFFHGDGLSVPPEATDRSYRLAFAAAVSIHCPKGVIGANVNSAWQVLAPGGQLRFQVLADPTDPTGVATPEQSQVVQDEVDEVVHQLTEEELRLTHHSYYMGDRFRYDEVEPFMHEHTGGEGRVALYRGDLAAIYGLVERP